MRLPDLAAVQRLIAAEVEESGLLDYKQDLVLKSPTQKRELCRDLTAMGNAGGGTLIYGLREAEGRDGIPEKIIPLTDRSLPLSVADIVRDSVRPPLLYEMAVHDVGDGFLLLVDVEPSGLGPYCVIGYGDFRFWKRHGKSKSEMSEAEIRDAYDLALRSADRQAMRWKERAFPLRPQHVDSLVTVSAIPREPVPDILDMRYLELDALRPPDFIQKYLQRWGLNPALHALQRWADGFSYEPPATPTSTHSALYAAIRVHRDGSLGIAEEVGPDIDIGQLLRMLNGHLVYASWLWEEFKLRRPVELRVELDGVQFCRIPKHTATTSSVPPVQPAGLTVAQVPLVREVLPWELARASARHRIVEEFCSRLVQTFGRARHDDLFSRGTLFERDGRATAFVLHGGGIVTAKRRTLEAAIDETGVMRNNVSRVTGYVSEGAVLDVDGNTIAVVEFAPGGGCPDDFLATEAKADLDTTIVPLRTSQPTTPPAPVPTRAWSAQTLAQVLAPVAE